MRNVADEALSAHLRKIFGASPRRKDFDGYRPVAKRVVRHGSPLADVVDLTLPEAKNLLLHSRLGASITDRFPSEPIDSLAAHLVEASRRHTNNKEAPMDNNLQKLRKAIGELSENDRYVILFKMAQEGRRDGESEAQAFARFYQSSDAVRLFDKGIPPDGDEREDDDEDALDPLGILETMAERRRAAEPGLTKAQAFQKVYTDPANAALVKIERERNGFAGAAPAPAPLAPTQVGGKDATDLDGTAAVDQLTEMAEELRRRSTVPLSAAQAFDRVYNDPANRELARRERSQNRPGV